MPSEGRKVSGFRCSLFKMEADAYDLPNKTTLLIVYNKETDEWACAINGEPQGKVQKKTALDTIHRLRNAGAWHVGTDDMKYKTWKYEY